ncbi:MAG: hypothetical protein HETSPECPRED_003703 [Heterodermia speciosa]|uniref:Aminoglycoside phosphotransferase domain-containing protein n=1 Tax=Heterodermia speciosa TaxID=116794 RepID=A0A8H3FA05_9LECA|nr:MAG: hypothetical protein HETSPECPRED_003703 [Heterodermia speciosa]
MATKARLQILHLSVDLDGFENHFRVLVDGKDIKYLSIDNGVYDVDDMAFPPALVPRLPTLPDGHWNLGHIAISENTRDPEFDWTVWKDFSSIRKLWHPVYVDYLSLRLGKCLRSNVCEVFSHRFPVPVIAKFARFPYETSYYDAETSIYALLEGHGIGPSFLGHVTEGERVIGFLLEKVDGRRAGIEDLDICRRLVTKLHGLGIVHGDLNRHNFLIWSSGAILIDFESACKSDDQVKMKEEMRGLEQQLCDTSGKGGVVEKISEKEKQVET